MRKAIDKLALIRGDCSANLCCCCKTVSLLRNTTGLFFSWPLQLEWWNTSDASRLPIQPRLSFFGSRSTITTAIVPVSASVISNAKGSQWLDASRTSELALLQFTSGTTSKPKGVKISHGNVWHNLNHIYLPTVRRSIELVRGTEAGALLPYISATRRLTGVNMLPAFHDSGLMLMLLGPFLAGWHMVHMSPLTFLAKPLTWLRAMSHYKAHWSAMPDFSYDLIVRRLGHDADGILKREGIDLSNVIKLGAGVGQRCQPVQLRRFLDAVADATRLRKDPDVWMPAYGLAEHVVATSFEIDGLVLSKVNPNLTSCGSHLLADAKIVDPITCEQVADGTSGELWLCSPSRAQGYWNKPELTREVFDGQLLPQDGRKWLRTGDIAFLEDGRLFICGRLKNMILVGGKNYHAEDCELKVEEACAGIMRPGCVAAFAVQPDEDQEYLVVAFECYKQNEEKALQAAEAASSAIARDIGVRPRRVVVVKERTIPKTTSGKIRRSATRDLLMAGELSCVADTSHNNELCSPNVAGDIPSTDASSVWISTVSRVAGLPNQECKCESDLDQEHSAANNTNTAPVEFGSSWLRRLEDDVLKAVASSNARFLEEPPANFEQLRLARLLDASQASNLVRDLTHSIVGVPHVVSDQRDTTVEWIIASVQLSYVQSVLIAQIREVLAVRDVDSRGCLVDYGLTSQDAARLQQAVRAALDVELDLAGLLQKSPISALAYEIYRIATGEQDYLAQMAQTFNLVCMTPRLSCVPPTWVFILMQTVGSLCVSLLVAAAILPAYHYGLHVQWKQEGLVDGTKRIYVRRHNEPFSHIAVAGTRNVQTFGLLVPLVIPIFMVSFSTIVLAAKWLIVGRYCEGTLKLGSAGFLKWWFVDRLLDFWELLCGAFLKDTIIIVIFYRLCGSRIALTSRIDTFVRDFDLIRIGEQATISGALYARSFVSGDYLQFESIVIEGYSKIMSGAVIMPGCVVGEGVILRHDSATLRGMRLSEYQMYESNPARLAQVDITKTAPNRQRRSLRFEMLKVCCLLPILYSQFLTSSALAAIVFDQIGINEWIFRYREFAYWVLAFLSANFVSILLVVAIKWLFLGRLRPGACNHSEWMQLRVWIIEFVWYRVVCRFGSVLFACNGCLTNLLYKALGADVALSASIATVQCISAAQADLVTIGDRAILSGCRIHCDGSDGTLKPVVFEAEVEVGFYTRIFAGAFVAVGAVIGHQTSIAEDETVDARLVRFGPATIVKQDDATERQSLHFASHLACAFVVRLIELFILAFVCLIPAYELAVLAFFGDANFYKDKEVIFGIKADGSIWKPPINRNLAVLLIGPTAIVAVMSMSVAYRVWQRFLLSDFPDGRMVRVYDSFCILYRDYQVMSLEITSLFMAFCRGSRLAVLYMRFWGATVDWDAFVNTAYFYEAPLTTLKKGCIMDDGNISIAHVLSAGRLWFKRKTVGSGSILHPWAVTWAGDAVSDGVILGPRSQLQSAMPRSGTDLENGPREQYQSHSLGTYLQGCPARVIRRP